MLWGADKKTNQEIREMGLETQQGSSTGGMGWGDTPSSDHRLLMLRPHHGGRKIFTEESRTRQSPQCCTPQALPCTHLLQPRDDAAVMEQVIAR